MSPHAYREGGQAEQPGEQRRQQQALGRIEECEHLEGCEGANAADIDKGDGTPLTVCHEFVGGDRAQVDQEDGEAGPQQKGQRVGRRRDRNHDHHHDAKGIADRDRLARDRFFKIEITLQEALFDREEYGREDRHLCIVGKH